jgi:hypothetical protein
MFQMLWRILFFAAQGTFGPKKIANGMQAAVTLTVTAAVT